MIGILQDEQDFLLSKGKKNEALSKVFK